MTSDWFQSINQPKYVVAPMVDASELAWRLLCRRHGAQLCYTPMFHSNVFTKDPKYRKENMVTNEEDRPLIVQFCGNNPEIMATAAKMVENCCDAIDINLGCPQSIAKRGHYGSFLQDEWDLLRNIISTMSKEVSVPITCKVRIFESIEKSVQYALMLQDAGCRLLTVHGRTRDQKGPLTGIASWKHIKAVREAVSVPMFANGNIQCLEDVHRCLEYTHANGVMSAEGALTNPALFEGINPVSWEMAEEYLNLVEKHSCPTSYIRGHLFKIFHKIFTFEENNSVRDILATAQNLDDFRRVCIEIKDKYFPYHHGKISFENDENITRQGFELILPPWICQPYVRLSPEEHTQKMEKCSQDNNNQIKRIYEGPDGGVLSRKKIKRMRRIARRPIKSDSQEHNGRNGGLCDSELCRNPLVKVCTYFETKLRPQGIIHGIGTFCLASNEGGKCIYKLCKKCCRSKCFEEDLDCPGHRILVHTRRKMAMKFAAEKNTKT